MSLRHFLIASTAVLLCGAGSALADTDGQQLAVNAGRSLIGTPAPAMVLTTIDGEHIDLARFYGHKAVYLKFWATWCVPCRQQMPHFEHVYEKAGDKLEVIAVNAGFDDSLADVKAYRQTVGLKMPIVIDDGQLADPLHLRVTPQHIVIGRDGRILYIGHLVDDRLEKALKTAVSMPVDSHPTMQAATEATPDATHAKAPIKAIRSLEGQELAFADPKGQQMTTLVFLSPWCESYLESSRPERAKACQHAREQTERAAAQPGMRWIGVASGLWATSEDLKQYRSDKKVTIPLALDETGAVFRQFAVHDVPTVIVVDAQGQVVKRGDAGS